MKRRFRSLAAIQSEGNADVRKQKTHLIDAALTAAFSGAAFFLYLFVTSGGDDMSWVTSIIAPAVGFGLVCGGFDFLRSMLKKK